MTGDQVSDADLMRDVALGHRRSLELLIRRHGSDVLTFIGRMVRASHLRDDIFQDVFLAVWKSRHQYEYPRALKPWLLKIAANKCREHARRSQRDAWPLEDRELLVCDDPDADLISRETSDEITASLGRLPKNQRMIVVLRIWNGLSYAEIARITGRSEGTVRSSMHHALNRLRERLQTRL